MPIQANLPEIKALRLMVESRLNKEIRVSNDFSILRGAICEATKKDLAESTLKRLWGYVDGYDTTRYTTLTILSQYVGFKNWEAFVEYLQNDAGVESELTFGKSIATNSLSVGDKVEIGWLPNRVMTIEYSGENKFVITDVKNSTNLKKSDTFECSCFIEGEILYLSNLCQGNKEPVNYIIGKKAGISSVRILPR